MDRTRDKIPELRAALFNFFDRLDAEIPDQQGKSEKFYHNFSDFSFEPPTDLSGLFKKFRFVLILTATISPPTLLQGSQPSL